MRARMGGSSAHRGGNANWWPRQAITYTRGAPETAALVTEMGETKLSVRLYAFDEKPHALQARVWRLDPGTYKLTLSNDKDNDGKADAGPAIVEREVRVVRGSFLDLTLPPKQGVVLSLTGVKTAPMTFDMETEPDPVSIKTNRPGPVEDFQQGRHTASIDGHGRHASALLRVPARLNTG